MIDDCCAICAEPLEWACMPQCGHHDCCSKCISRLRFIQKNKKCPICNVESPSVYVTHFSGQYTKPVASLVAQAEKGELYYNDIIEAYFDDERHADEIKDICSIKCPECIKNGVPGGGESFRSTGALKKHLSTHGLQFCDVCLGSRQVFIGEQILYTKEELDRHLKAGDLTGPLAESGFKGHPRCKFCRTHFYGDNELFHHMQRAHERCFVCQRAKPDEFVYFHHYQELERHFQSAHHMCSDPACVERRFVVFATAEELRQHSALEHGENMSRAQKKANLAISINFTYRRAEATDESQVIQRSSLTDVAVAQGLAIAVGGGSGLPSTGRERSTRGGGRGSRNSSHPDLQAAANGSAAPPPAPPTPSGPTLEERLRNESFFPALPSGTPAAAMVPASSSTRWASTAAAGMGGGSRLAVSSSAAAGPERAAQQQRAREEDFPALPAPSAPAGFGRGGPPMPGSLAAKLAAHAKISVKNTGKAPVVKPKKNNVLDLVPGWDSPSDPYRSASPQPAAGPGPSAAAVVARGAAALDEYRPPERPNRPPVSAEEFPSLPTASAPPPRWANQVPLPGKKAPNRNPFGGWANSPTIISADHSRSSSSGGGLGLGGGPTPAQAAAAARPPSAATAAAAPASSNNPSKKKQQQQKQQAVVSAPPPAPAPAPSSAADPSTVSEAVREANRDLMRRMKARLDPETFGTFKVESARFMEGSLPVEEYYALAATLGISDLMADLAVLCPIPQRRDELLALHTQALKRAAQHKQQQQHIKAEKKREKEIAKQAPPAAPPAPQQQQPARMPEPAKASTAAAEAAAAAAAARALPEVPSGPWQCPQCTLDNSVNAMVCDACDAPRPGLKQVGSGKGRRVRN